MKKPLKFFLTILVLVPLGTYLAFFALGQLVQIRDEGMSPMIQYKQYVWLDSVSYRFLTPGKGDIVVYIDPTTASKGSVWDRRIGRIIAVPGNAVQIRGGKVFVNGVVLDEPYIEKGVSEDTPRPGRLEEEVTLSKDVYIILADNRIRGVDSRSLGSVPRANIVGKVRLF